MCSVLSVVLCHNRHYGLCGSVCFLFWWIVCFFFFFKQKTAYEMRISDWSSDVCSSDLFDRTQGIDIVFDRSRYIRPHRTLFFHMQAQSCAPLLPPRHPRCIGSGKPCVVGIVAVLHRCDSYRRPNCYKFYNKMKQKCAVKWRGMQRSRDGRQRTEERKRGG